MAKSLILHGMALGLIGWLLCGDALSQPPNAGRKDKKRPPKSAPADEPRPDRPAVPRRPRPDGKPPAGSEDRRPEIMRKYDRDRNGRIDDDEREKLVEDMKRRGLRKDDIARQLERLAIIERFDKDGDGMLNEEELAAARDAAKGDKPPVGDEPKKRPSSKKQQETLEKYDADGDGKLSAAERAKIQQDLKAKREEDARRRAEEKKRK
jgi:Ca2+-binding EF-hand superfamily protein